MNPPRPPLKKDDTQNKRVTIVGSKTVTTPIFRPPVNPGRTIIYVPRAPNPANPALSNIRQPGTVPMLAMRPPTSPLLRQIGPQTARSLMPPPLSPLTRSANPSQIRQVNYANRGQILINSSTPTLQATNTMKLANADGGRRIVHLPINRKTTGFRGGQEMPIKHSSAFAQKTVGSIDVTRDSTNKTITSFNGPGSSKITSVGSVVATYDMPPDRGSISAMLGFPNKGDPNVIRDFNNDAQSQKGKTFLILSVLKDRLRRAAFLQGMGEPSEDVAQLLSNACEEHLKDIIEKLCVGADHRQENLRNDVRYQLQANPRAQLDFFREAEEAREKNVIDFEGEFGKNISEVKARLEEAHKSKLEAQYRRDTEATAMQAILGRKKPKIEQKTFPGIGGHVPNPISEGLKRRKYLTKNDLIFVLEREKGYRNFLHKVYMS